MFLRQLIEFMHRLFEMRLILFRLFSLISVSDEEPKRDLTFRLKASKKRAENVFTCTCSGTCL